MQENSWPESSSFNEFDPLNSLLGDFTELPDPEPRPLQTKDFRRRKAAVVLVVIWSSTVALHCFTGGFWIVCGLTTLMGVHALRLLTAGVRSVIGSDAGELVADLAGIGLDPENPQDYPFISLLVAAKNEEAVVERLVQTLCQLKYPRQRYELWIIDDNSSDQTPILLEKLACQYSQLRVLRRLPGAGGGKSGALNQVLPLTRGEIIGVFDADAQVPADLLQRVLPLFQQDRVGAVQVRKAIVNASENFWTRGQQVEMIVDAYFQQQRARIQGIGELRGNGQFVRRRALERCGGWNEQTITDDLDLSLRLHLDQWDIQVLMDPAVGEEGVTGPLALWHQRNRWAEGGYQSYLDYWRQIAQNRLGTQKTLDLFIHWMIKYALPTAALPDLLMAMVRNRTPILLPMTSLTVALSFVGMLQGLRQVRQAQLEQVQTTTSDTTTTSARFSFVLVALFQSMQGTLYMLHWLPVVSSVTARVSVRPKRLKWVKTVHQGHQEPEVAEAG